MEPRHHRGASTPFRSACASSAFWTRSCSGSTSASPCSSWSRPSYFDLSLKEALLATLVGGLIGNAMLGVAALIGADARVPAMVLQRAPLGRRGSYWRRV